MSAWEEEMKLDVKKKLQFACQLLVAIFFLQKGETCSVAETYYVVYAGICGFPF